MNRAGSAVISLTLLLSAVLAGMTTASASSPSSSAAAQQPAGMKPVTKTLFGLKVTISLLSEFAEIQKDQKLDSTAGYDVFWAPPFGKSDSTRPTLAIAVFSVGALPPEAHSTDLSEAFGTATFEGHQKNMGANGLGSGSHSKHASDTAKGSTVWQNRIDGGDI